MIQPRYHEIQCIRNANNRLIPMVNETDLHPSTHSHLGWRQFSGFRFARHVTLQPLAVAEIPRVAQVMPVAFLRQGQAWRAAGVMGSAYGENVYVAEDGRWRGHFVPAALRVYPFALSEQDEERLALWPGYEPGELDDASRDADGLTPFFEEGRYTPLLQKTLAFLQQVKRGQADVHEPLAMLHELGLLTPWRVPAEEGQDASRELEGLYRVAPERWALLDDSDWLELRRCGALEWLYAHLHSLHHAERFKAMERRQERASRWAPEESDEQNQAAALLAAMFEQSDEHPSR
ncbi:SapC family protein [Halomonas mongoliensis]|uniref:SapC family protein n=1 Tax=Halomonas mongoliensis TaxID=321265 RepID=UPI00403A8FD8